ncbi:MAG: hypothetical protein H6765_10760 [Candidatus Peribacteria bacterium]|nr:MAG: hypothetical protein H6765_10760 [Candidatus Peribacteria bacterium]
MPLLDAKQDLITKHFKGEEFDQVLMKLRDKQISITKLIKEYYGDSIDLRPELPKTDEIQQLKREIQ